MNYKVLYRKYRPQTFEDELGQDITISVLKDSIINERIAHAYIFSGPRGTGKTSAAKIFARAINCTNNNDGNPCLQCDSCCMQADNPDIYEIDAASNNGVDQIREIVDNIKLAPINSKYKVYIIDEVHMLSTSAFNALLLTLEEPPSHVVFILATTNIENVPITVLSRCQRLDFKKISTQIIVKNLKKISDNEGISIDAAALEEIANYADGGMRDALSILDQLSKSGEQITCDMVISSLGAVSDTKVGQLIKYIGAYENDKIVRFIDELRQNAADYKTVVKKVIKKMKFSTINDNNELIDYKRAKRIIFELADTLNRVNTSIDLYDLMEMVLCEPFADGAQVKQIENSTRLSVEIKSFDIGDKNLISSSDNNDFKRIRVNNTFVGANKGSLNFAKNSWNTFINEVENKKMMGMIVDSTIVLASESSCVIKVALDISANNINAAISELESLYENFSGKFVKFVAICSSDWDKYMEEYKKNIANGYKYVLIDESSVSKKGILDDVFSSNIEIR